MPEHGSLKQTMSEWIVWVASTKASGYEQSMRFKLIIAILMVPMAASVARSQGTAQERVENWLAQMDADKSGTIEESEAGGQMARNFNRIDANNDGSVDRKELTALAIRFGAQQRSSANRNQNAAREQDSLTDAQVIQRVPQGVKAELNIPYREGHERWKLDLFMPADESAEPRPGIVFVHGGGWRSGDKRRGGFLNPAIEYAARGYVCITVNYRLGGPILDCVQDVKCAVRWLRAHADTYNLDPDRIGAYGNSAGAHLVTMLGISYTNNDLEGDGPWQSFSSRVQAVVASATPTSMGGRTETDSSTDMIKPMSYITADAPPFLLVHEESDRTVPVSNSDDFVKAMKEVGAKDINYKRYTDGSGHGVFQENIEETGPLMEAFFERTLRK